MGDADGCQVHNVLTGWQENDLPIFGHIQSIIVINNVALLIVSLYNAYGIDRHYHSFAVKETGEVITQCLTRLIAYQTFRTHVKNGTLLITFRSFIENTHI